jgi:hypothetical protein
MFSLPQDVQQLERTAYLDTVLRPVSAQSVLRRDSFGNGEIQFRFSSTAPDKYFFPSKSFFQLQVRITRNDGTPLRKSDGIALAQNCAANLFSSCQVKLGGQLVSNTSRHLPQIDALRQRMEKGPNWLNSVGDQFNMWGDWQSRRDRICIDSTENLRENGTKVDITQISPNTDAAGAWPAGARYQMQYIPASETGYGSARREGFFSRNRARIVFQRAGTTTFQSGYENVIRKYDRIYTPHGTFHVDRVETTSDIVIGGTYSVAAIAAETTNLVVWLLEDDADTIGKAQLHHSSGVSLSAAPAEGVRNNVVGDTALFEWQPMKANLGCSDIELMWAPPSALFHSHQGPIPQAAEIEIVLQPSNHYLRAAVEARPTGLRDEPNGPVPSTSYESTDGRYKFSVERMIFHLCETRANIFKQRKFVLDLHEIAAQSTNIPSADLSESPFTVNRATRALTVAFTDKRQDTDARMSRSVFKAYSSTEQVTQGRLVPVHENLRTLMLDYAGQQYPLNQPEFSLTGGDDYSTTGVPVLGRNYFTQRYLENLLYQGNLDDVIGAETFREWLDRGYYIHWQCDKAGGNEATRVIVKHQLEQGTDVSQATLMLFEHYRNIVEVTLNDIGRIDQVKTWSLI